MPRNSNKTDYSGGFLAGFEAFATVTDLSRVFRAIDGKALRGSRSGETSHLHAISA